MATSSTVSGSRSNIQYAVAVPSQYVRSTQPGYRRTEVSTRAVCARSNACCTARVGWHSAEKGERCMSHYVQGDDALCGGVPLISYSTFPDAPLPHASAALSCEHLVATPLPRSFHLRYSLRDPLPLWPMNKNTVRMSGPTVPLAPFTRRRPVPDPCCHTPMCRYRSRGVPGSSPCRSNSQQNCRNLVRVHTSSSTPFLHTSSSTPFFL